MNTTERGWAEYWQEEGAGGEVFVSAKGERHPALAAHWQSVFDGLPIGATVLDIASGAGSIYASLPGDHGYELHASDIAAEALAVLESRIEGVTTHVCGADALPFDDESFDLVVSQFGIEYAGPDAFAEAARVVAKGGGFDALVHIEDGYVDSNNAAQLAEAALARESGFIEAAIALTRAAFGSDASRLAGQEQAFIPLIGTLGDAVRRCPRGVHAYLLGGFRQLYENRLRYDESDITGWLEGMRGEVDRSVDRLTRMREAAQSKADIEAIRGRLQASGLADVEVTRFSLPDKDLPLAWHLTAERR